MTLQTEERCPFPEILPSTSVLSSHSNRLLLATKELMQLLHSSPSPILSLIPSIPYKNDFERVITITGLYRGEIVVQRHSVACLL